MVSESADKLNRGDLRSCEERFCAQGKESLLYSLGMIGMLTIRLLHVEGSRDTPPTLVTAAVAEMKKFSWKESNKFEWAGNEAYKS